MAGPRILDTEPEAGPRSGTKPDLGVAAWPNGSPNWSTPISGPRGSTRRRFPRPLAVGPGHGHDHTELGRGSWPGPSGWKAKTFSAPPPPPQPPGARGAGLPSGGGGAGEGEVRPLDAGSPEPLAVWHRPSRVPSWASFSSSRRVTGLGDSIFKVLFTLRNLNPPSPRCDV